MGAIAVALGSIAALAFGVPLYWILGKRIDMNFFTCVSAGICVGIFSYLMFATAICSTCTFAPPLHDAAVRVLEMIWGLLEEPGFLTISGLLGGIGGAVFWAVAKPERNGQRKVTANIRS